MGAAKGIGTAARRFELANQLAALREELDAAAKELEGDGNPLDSLKEALAGLGSGTAAALRGLTKGTFSSDPRFASQGPARIAKQQASDVSSIKNDLSAVRKRVDQAGPGGLTFE